MKEQFFPKNCRGFIDVTKPPYSVDNTGKVDCTETICKIIDDLLQVQIDAVKDMYKKLEEHDGDGPVVDTRNGGYTEILGGIMSIGRNKLTPVVASTDSNVSAILATNSYTQLANYPVAVTDTRKGSPRHLFASSLPYRVFPFTFIPLYTGYAGQPEKKDKELYNLY